MKWWSLVIWVVINGDTISIRIIMKIRVYHHLLYHWEWNSNSICNLLQPPGTHQLDNPGCSSLWLHLDVDRWSFRDYPLLFFRCWSKASISRRWSTAFARSSSDISAQAIPWRKMSTTWLGLPMLLSNPCAIKPLRSRSVRGILWELISCVKCCDESIITPHLLIDNILMVDGRGTLTPADQGSDGALPTMLLQLLTVHVHRLVTAHWKISVWSLVGWYQ